VADARTPTGRPHKGLVRALLIFASLLVVIACFATWAERQALTTDDWVNTSGKLLENEDIRSALANYAVSELYANVDVERELDEALPRNFKRLSGPASSGLRELAINGAERVLASSRFQTLWENANRAAHETLINVIEDKGDAVSTGGGDVQLELRPLIIRVANQLGLGQDLADRLPPDVGTLTILHSDELDLAQTIARLVRGLALVTSLLALGLFGLAIYLSRGYRWVTVLGVGIGFIVAGILVLILRELAGGVVADQLASQGAEPAADAAWSIGTSLLASIARNVILFGVFFVVAAWLMSPHRSSVATRRALTPILRDYPIWVGSAFVLIAAIYVVSGVDSTRAILTRGLLMAMAGFGLFELRRKSIVEFPDATIGELPARIRTRASSIWRGRERAAPAPEDKRLERLERLASLHERGTLSDEEFESEKAALLAGRRPDG
jgi:Short C-terminal domain